MYYVYAIGPIIEIENKDYSNCYIGVTNDLEHRWITGHSKSKYRVGDAIRENGWSIHNMIIIYSGSKQECFNLERELRPMPMMGLNEASGGNGGYTKYTSERNQKISNALKGIPKTYGDKISKVRKENGSAKGEKNPKAVKWILKDPSGKEFNLNGSLFTFCDENKLSANTLRKYLNNVVPLPSSKYRDYGKIEVRQIRDNTTGWCLCKEK